MWGLLLIKSQNNFFQNLTSGLPSDLLFKECVFPALSYDYTSIRMWKCACEHPEMRRDSTQAMEDSLSWKNKIKMNMRCSGHCAFEHHTCTRSLTQKQQTTILWEVISHGKFVIFCLQVCLHVISSWSQVEHLQAVSLDSQISANKWTVIMLMGWTELRRIRQQDLDFTDKLCCFLGRGVNFFLEYVICHIKYGSGIRGCPKLVSHFCSFQLIMHCEV